MDGLTIEIIPDGRLSKNGLRRSNWRTSQALVKKAREDAYVLGLIELQEGVWETPDRVEIDIVQYYARTPLDFDGLACVCAPTIDGLVDCQILEDDDPGHVARYNLRHEKVGTIAENRIAITVRPVSE